LLAERTFFVRPAFIHHQSGDRLTRYSRDTAGKVSRRNRPAPIWILGDSADPYLTLRISSDTINPVSGIRIEDYALLDHRGRFVLFKKKE
jgi:hypothetical protein